MSMLVGKLLELLGANEIVELEPNSHHKEHMKHEVNGAKLDGKLDEAETGGAVKSLPCFLHANGT